MRLEALPAAKGDCLILHTEVEGLPKLVLIDGGPSGVYRNALRQRLIAIRDERIDGGLIAEEDKLHIDLLIISHIDDDHINGIKALLEDMAGAGAPFSIGRIWHNAFSSLVDAEGPTNPTTSSVLASIGPPGDPSPDPHSDREGHDLHEVLASIPQGHAVQELADKLRIAVNPEFDRRPVVATAGAVHVAEDLGLTFTVIGPLSSELAALRKIFADWLRKRKALSEGGAAVASLAEVLASFDDISVPNLSSIVLLVDDGTQRLLLTGDARGDHMMRAVSELGLLDKGQLAVDVLKVPHHGSNRNVTVEFFSCFPANEYVISGNGEHGNPDIETLEFIDEAKGGREYGLRLTYKPAEIDATRVKKAHGGGRGHDTCIEPYLQAHSNIRVTIG